MGEKIAVSVVCMAFNQENYIREALDGIVMQKTTFRMEVLVHDDASTDQTANIIHEYELMYPDIIKPIYQTENQYSKHNGTIHRLLSDQASGKYIALCEGDDYWIDPYKLQKQYDFMETHPEYSLCGCSTLQLNEYTGKIMPFSITKVDRDFSLNEFINPSNGRPFPTVSFFMRSEIYQTRPLWGFPVGDLPMTYYAAMKGKVRMLADTMCVYRRYSKGSWTMRENTFSERAKIHMKMIDGYECMNRDTDYIYDSWIQRRILVHRYSAAKLNHDFKTLTSGELGRMYHRRSFSHRVMDRLCCQMPRVYMFLERIMGRSYLSID